MLRYSVPEVSVDVTNLNLNLEQDTVFYCYIIVIFLLPLCSGVLKREFISHF